MILNGRLAFVFTAAFLVGVFLDPSSAQAQLQEVDQTVFGMDCAPCAYALENRLNNMEGVASVSVSLNEGVATIELEPANSLTLGAIREAVHKSGFSPEDATLQITGTVQQEGGEWILSVPSGERYLVELEEATLSEEELTRRRGQEVTLIGHISEGEEPPEKGWVLYASEFEEGA